MKATKPQRDCPQPEACSLQPDFQYHPAGWRMWNSNKGSYLYGPGGQLLTTNGTGPSAGYTDYVYFGGRLLYTLSTGEHGYTAVTRMYSDRLGSTRATQTQEYIWNSTTTRNYYPYGEEIGSTANDQYKFASTYRDSTTSLDYALNRYYASGTARFLTPDPYQASGGASVPQNWNRYTYVHNDPINYFDPSGTNEADPNSAPLLPGLTLGFFFIPGTAEGMPTLVGYGAVRPTNMPPAPSGTTGGSTSDGWASASKALEQARDAVAYAFSGAAELSEECQSDLGALGISAKSLFLAAGNAVFKNGIGSTDKYYTLFQPGTDEYNTALSRMPDYTIGEEMAKPGVKAVSSLNGNSIYMNAAYINSNNAIYNAALVTHELLHNLGLQDDGIKAALGITGSGSAGITSRIEQNCFTPKPVTLP